MAMTKLVAARWHQANHITVTYLKRLFNDHFLVFLVIAFGAGVLGYRELLTDPRYMQLWQSPWLIAAVVLWLVVGLQFGALITYFKPADALFLMGGDQQLVKHHLPRAFAVSYGVAMVWQSAIIGLIVPILWQIGGMSGWRLALLWCIVLAYKGQLLLIARQRLFLTLQQSNHAWRRGVQAIIYRVVIPGGLLTLLLTVPQKWLGLVGLTLLIILCLAGYRYWLTATRAKSLAINWPIAIAQAQQHEQRVYRFYATFAEIPNQPRTIKRRRYLDGVIKTLTKRQSVMYRLYLIRLARDNDSLPLAMRLAVLGLLLVWALAQAPIWLVAVIAAAVMYLITFQLLPLYTNTQQTLWTRLMPVSPATQQQAFITLNQQLNGLVASLLVWASWPHGWATMGATLISVVVMWLFLSRVYLPKQLNKKRF